MTFLRHIVLLMLPFAVCLAAADAQITANEAATELDELQTDYVETVSNGGTSAEFINLASRLEALERRIDQAGLKQNLIDIYDLSRYQRAWCYFRLGESTGDFNEFEKARSLFATLSGQAVDDDVSGFSVYMQGESRFWQSLLSKWKAMVNPAYAITDLQRAFDCIDESLSSFQTSAANSRLPDRTRFASSIRNGDVSFETAKLFQAVGDTSAARQAFEDCKYGNRADANHSGSQTENRIKDYSEAMRCLWQIFSDDDPDNCAQIASTPGVYNIGGDGILRDAILSHNSAMNDASLWPVTESLYMQAADSEGTTEGLYWQSLVNLLRGETDAVALFEDFVSGGFDERNYRTLALKDDAQRRINLEKETVTRENVRTFLRPGPPEYLVDQAIANSKYLIRRAASYITWGWKKPYLGKANIFLDFADDIIGQSGFSGTGTMRHEINFYRQIARFMSVAKFGSPSQEANEFHRISDNLAGIGFRFELEARYIRAICLYEAWLRWSAIGNDEEKNLAEQLLAQARGIFEDLIQSHRSVRSLYRLAEINRVADSNPDAARICYEKVIAKTKDCDALSFMVGNCEAGIGLLPQGDGSRNNLAALRIDQVRCPDYLVTDENVYWEGLSDYNGAMAVFAEESRQLLMQYALPKKNIYPTDRIYKTSVLLPDCFPGDKRFTAQVPDVIRLNPVWDLEVLVLREDGPMAVKDERIRYTITGADNTVHSPVDNRFTQTDIPLGSDVTVTFTLDGYYPEVVDYLSSDLSGWRVMDTVVLAAVTGRYSKKGISSTGGIKHYYRPKDNNLVIHADDGFPSGDTKKRLEKDLRVRDGIRVSDDLTLTVHADSGVYAHSKGKSTLYSETALVSPEGVAVDKKGRIYVADYGGDQVLIFGNDGAKKQTMFSTGRNTTASVEEQGHLVLPTRIAIETDSQGLTYSFPHDSVGKNSEGNDTVITVTHTAKVHRSPRILVADQYGLHRFDMHGHFLDSPIPVGSEWPESGDLWGFEMIGYGLNSHIVVGNRNTGKLVSFEQ